ncbi:hypothetical protein ARMSODRAFT_1027269 [Armillaria solidipes]|uniref:Uncharacterized protein n=1 Tax=Armillaria solidipes TaxID=1076256 RepID=A0A2H3AL99_9AGAR|nr:hypothetical protein ARMSODRAFT_1027269 [Armillaria solidipes]
MDLASVYVFLPVIFVFILLRLEQMFVQHLKQRWQRKKMSVYEFFKRSLESWPLDEGTESPPNPWNHPKFLKITLSALAETGQAESTIPVLKQRSYTGSKTVISSALADTPCADLGIDGVLEKLNETLSTSYTLGSRVLRLLGVVQLHSFLEPYVARNDDFGTVYAHLRPYSYLRRSREENLDCFGFKSCRHVCEPIDGSIVTRTRGAFIKSDNKKIIILHGSEPYSPFFE